MIPIRLELRNFLPYRAPDPVKFEGIHLACLTGPNGAGKSSILDAITWALWGKARGRDEDLIHQGQEDMYVQLDFLQEGNTFRVLRKRARAKKSSTGTLDMFRLAPDGQWKLDNEPSMRATQTKINALLRLDYETFTHSAFLQQGKADAFTTQTPAERKRILSDILGLDQWSRYEDRAKEVIKKIEENLAFCDSRIREIDGDLAREPALLAEVDAAQASHADAHGLLEVAQARKKELEGVPTALKAAKERKSEHEAHMRHLRVELDEVSETIARQVKQIEEHREVIARSAEIEQGYNTLRNAREVDEALAEKLIQLRSLDEARAELVSQLSAARARLETEAQNLRQGIEESQRLIDADPSDDLESLQAEVNSLQSIEVERNDLLRRETEMKERRAEVGTLMKTLEAEGKAKGLRRQRVEETVSPVCPFCGQPLSDEHRQKVIEELTAEIEAMRDEYKLKRDEQTDLNVQLTAIRIDIEKMEADIKRLPALNERAGKLAAQVDSAGLAAVRLGEDAIRLEQVEAALATESFAPDIREALLKLDEQQSELGYDQTTHNDARQSLKDYQRFENLWTRLEMAVQSLPQWEEMLEGSRKREERLTAAATERQAEIDALETEIVELTVQDEEFRRREEEERAQHTLERMAYERLVNAQQALMSLEAQRTRKAELEKRREKLRYEEAIYKELRTAFGKNGVPAMIIETAIPELEQTANDLLSRMTDGRMHLRLMTQREKVSGGMTETLDIEISDELGTRNYEMYSGGEAFRINFAVRIALSQLLARRAGAQLRTLFIDEGFGTQDEAGRNKLVEAITAIQDDFDLILVITHIDELRDSFPVHVIVDKTPNGSRISIR